MGSTRPLLELTCALALLSCGGNSAAPLLTDASVGGDAASAQDGGAIPDVLLGGPETGGAGDAGPESGTVEASDCTFADGGATLDASSRFQGSCANGCPAGTICAVEIGGVAGGGGEYCAPIVDRCRGNPTCACLASCVCGASFGRPERCTDPSDASSQGAISCDNGIR